jgi:hypothetical protein
MVLKNCNIFHAEALQNFPKLRFLVWKCIIWQPWDAVCYSVSKDDFLSIIELAKLQGDQMSL